MNLSAIKARLEALNQDNQSSRVENAEKFWKPQVGKSIVRIVPSKFNPDDPFTELKFHNTISRFPILALSNFGKQDPVEDLIEELRKTNNKDNWSLSGKISPRLRYFVPVIVRGEEDKGVRIWSISTTVYKALLTIAADEEYGDFTDIVNGFDMVVEKTPAAGPGQYPEITVRAKRNSSKLSENKEEVEKWLTEQPEPIKLFRENSYDYIKKILENYLTGKDLNGAAEPEGEKKPSAGQKAASELALKVEENKVEVPVEAPKPKPAPAPAPATKTSVTSKFDDLFSDSDDEDGNLPF